MSERAQSRVSIPSWRLICAAWGLVALAYTPAAWLTNGAASWRALSVTLGAMLLFFVPWALVTPAVLRAGGRLPLGGSRTLRSVGWLGAIGIVLIPAATALGLFLDEAAAWLSGKRPFAPLLQIGHGVVITSFFSVPIYVALIGIGQALLWVRLTGERERQRADARLDALRAQINPHFLFNALTAIGELAHNDANGAQTAIARLAHVLRATFTIRTAYLTLAEEIAIMRDHVELYRLLLPGELDFRVSASTTAWHARVPSLILQPLVENALVHALSRVAEGRLRIAAEDREGRLLVRVENALPGNVVPSRGSGSGLTNVRERLATLYGPQATLAADVQGACFVVTLDLPLVAGGEGPE